MALFGTNGVRGRLDLLTPRLAFDLSSAFATWGKGHTIALAHDMRLTSPLIHASAASGIMSAGCDVLDLGLCSSPVAEWSLEKYGADGLIIVTASHNPPEWNALKFVDKHGIAVSRERGSIIEEIALKKGQADAPWDKVGKPIRRSAASSEHSAAVLSSIATQKIRSRKLRIVLDFGNGTSALSRSVFDSLGCEVIALNEKIDGNFPGRLSEPSEHNVRDMLNAVRENSADFGVAWDGDSDRVVFADEKGNWIVGDKGFAISALQACSEAKQQKGKVVVTTVATSRCVEEACAKLGAKTVYTAVGAPYLSEKMVELRGRAVSGGEEVGGIIWPNFSLAKDGIFAAAKLCEMACSEPLSEIVGRLPAYYNAKAKPEARRERMPAALEAAKKQAKQSGGKLLLVDGVRADFEDSWVIIRASGTEDAMRIFAEAKTQKRADLLRKEYESIVEQALSGGS